MYVYMYTYINFKIWKGRIHTKFMKRVASEEVE